MQLKLCSAATFKMRCRSVGATAASVRTKPSIVAMFGPIIAAPLANPVIVYPAFWRVATLMPVSVVRMAWAAFEKASRPVAASRVAFGMPASSTGIGSGRPITPVEATSTCSGAQPSSRATSSAMRSASARPCSPVQAFALPEQMTIARASGRGSRSRLTCTGAAHTRFCVNTPAAAAGESLTMTARSRRSGSVRSPLTMPANR